MNNEIVVYQPNEALKLEVRLENETVWLNQQQMSELFQTTRNNVTLHIRNVFKEKELDEVSVCKESLLTAADGKKYRTKFYNLDVIISVGYRVKSRRGTQFRIWATRVLKEYLLRGVAFNARLEQLEEKVDKRFAKHDRDIVDLQKKVDFFIRTELPPKEMVLVAGRMLDAQAELTRIVKTAKKRIVLIDNYIDERTLMLLGNRRAGVACTVYTLRPNSPKLAPALANYARQFPKLPITMLGYKKSHDRFLVTDSTVWHIGASLKDAGASLFALMKMELDPSVILSLLPTSNANTLDLNTTPL
mgnify:FL=1